MKELTRRELLKVGGLSLAALSNRTGGKVGEPLVLSAELEFLAYLLAKLRYAKEKGLKEELEVTYKAFKDFFKDHIGRWYRIFSDLLQKESQQAFYRELGKLLRAFLDSERDREGIDNLIDIEVYRKELLEGSSWECGPLP